ncbi:hypothetical protein AOLI_G00040170 [Acnodon oligacanthus]
MFSGLQLLCLCSCDLHSTCPHVSADLCSFQLRWRTSSSSRRATGRKTPPHRNQAGTFFRKTAREDMALTLSLWQNPLCSVCVCVCVCVLDFGLSLCNP